MRFPYRLNGTSYNTELPSIESRRNEVIYRLTGISAALAAGNLALEYRKTGKISRRDILQSLLFVAFQERMSHILAPIMVPDEEADKTDRINKGLEDKLPR